jgi:hypothetical protein
MPDARSHESHDPRTDVREDIEPGVMPLDPDTGPETLPLQDDPEPEHKIDRGPDQTPPGQGVRHSVEVAGCP